MSTRGYNCSHHPKEINPDNDITGIGVSAANPIASSRTRDPVLTVIEVTIGYIATAGIVVAIIVVHYLTIYQPGLDPFRKDNDTVELTNKPVEFRPNPLDEMVTGFFHRIGRKMTGGGRISSRTHRRLEHAITKVSRDDSDI